jgi:hypothetical protein
MKSILLVPFLVLIAFSDACAQDTSILKRTPYKLTVFVDKKNYYEEDIGAIPYIFPNRTVQMYPGEIIYLEVEQKDGIIRSMTPVKELSKKSSTLVLKFAQNAKNNVHESMMLTIENPFPFELTYESKIFLLKQKQWADTNVYPVKPGISGIEIWPDIITSIALGNWSFKAQ